LRLSSLFLLFGLSGLACPSGFLLPLFRARSFSVGASVFALGLPSAKTAAGLYWTAGAQLVSFIFGLVGSGLKCKGIFK
jgi:hypothetical protein